jgi:hypothetical protein
MAETERYGGKPFTWGGKTYLLAPIGLGWMQRVMRESQEIAAGKFGAEEAMEKMIGVINRSLQRNYPEMTPEFIREEILDLVNVGDLYHLAIEASGGKPRSKPEAESPPASTT